jgi:hypothetical protein
VDWIFLFQTGNGSFVEVESNKFLKVDLLEYWIAKFPYRKGPTMKEGFNTVLS